LGGIYTNIPPVATPLFVMLLSKATLRVLPVRLSVRPSVPHWLLTRKKAQKTKVGVNVSRGRSSRFVSFQNERSEIKIIWLRKPHENDAYLCQL